MVHSETATAWAQVASSFCLMFNTWGFVNAYGVFQEYYTSLEPVVGSVDSVTWIGSIQTFLMLLGASVTGPIVDKGHASLLSTFGTAISALSLLFTSFSGEFTDAKVPIYWQIFLSQGIMCGLGMGLLMVPSTAIIPTYFTTRRAFATGLGMTGASIGGIVYPILIRRLLARIGYSWTLRAAALIMLVTNGVGTFLMRQKQSTSRKRFKFDFIAFGNPAFSLTVISLWAALVGLYVPYFYIVTWVRDNNVDLNRMPQYYLLSILNAGGLLGRVVPNLVADRIGPIIVQAFACLVCGALVVAWTHITPSVAWVISFVVLYGFFSGAVINLIPASISSLTTDMTTIGARLGMVLALNAFALLLGSPIAGVILRSIGVWHYVGAYSASFIIFGGISMFAAWGLGQRKRPIRHE